MEKRIKAIPDTGIVIIDSFQKRLKFALEYAGIGQNELARRCGISKGAVSGWLSGRFTPKRKNSLKIAEILNVSASWLEGTTFYIYREERFLMFESVDEITVGMCVYDIKYGAFALVYRIDRRNRNIFLLGGKGNKVVKESNGCEEMPLHEYSVEFEESRLYMYTVEKENNHD